MGVNCNLAPPSVSQMKKAAAAAFSHAGSEWRSGRARRLRRLGSGLCSAPRVLLLELLDASSRVDDFLPTGVERVARRAHLDVEILAEGRAGLEGIPARAGDGDFLVVRMDPGFHGASFQVGSVSRSAGWESAFRADFGSARLSPKRARGATHSTECRRAGF